MGKSLFQGRNKMASLKKTLESFGHDSKERAMIYAGALAGATIPVLAFRYFAPNWGPQNIPEALVWVNSVAFAWPFSAVGALLGTSYTSNYLTYRKNSCNLVERKGLEKKLDSQER